MAIKFKTADQIDKLADHEIAKILSESKRLADLMSRGVENLKKAYSKKRNIEYQKHAAEARLKFLKSVGRKPAQIKLVETEIAAFDEGLLKLEEEEMNIYKSMETLPKFAIADIERLKRITRKEEKFTAKELSALKTLLKACLPKKRFK